MPSLWCVLCLLFLGAALAAPLYWLLRRRRAHAAPPPPARAPNPASGILYLSPASLRALGTCAAPQRLRNMPVANIARRLARGVFTPDDPMPTPGQYGSWPEQARLLCAGRQAELADLQRELVRDHGEPVWRPPAPPDLPAPDAGAGGETGADAREERRALRRMLALMLVFLLLALLAYLLGDRCRLPLAPPCRDSQQTPVAPLPVPDCRGTVTESTIELSNDVLFDYNRHEPIHRAKARDQLQAMLAQHDRIEIIAIQGHTDPIGSTEGNQVLGARRAKHVRDLLAELMHDPATAGQFMPAQQLPAPSGSGPNKGEFDIWSACFATFQQPQPGRADRRKPPLEDLDPSVNDGRTPCVQATADTGRSDGRYPACTRMRLPQAGKPMPADYPQRAEQLREMIACLAPMRHVEIRFRSRRLVPAAVLPPTRSPE